MYWFDTVTVTVWVTQTRGLTPYVKNCRERDTGKIIRACDSDTSTTAYQYHKCFDTYIGEDNDRFDILLLTKRPNCVPGSTRGCAVRVRPADLGRHQEPPNILREVHLQPSEGQQRISWSFSWRSPLNDIEVCVSQLVANYNGSAHFDIWCSAADFPNWQFTLSGNELPLCSLTSVTASG